MEKRKRKDRRRFARLGDRRKQISEGISNLAWFEIIVGLAVIIVLAGYWYVLIKY